MTERIKITANQIQMTIVWCSALFDVASSAVFSPNTIQTFNTAGHTDAQSDLVVFAYAQIMFACVSVCLVESTVLIPRLEDVLR